MGDDHGNGICFMLGVGVGVVIISLIWVLFDHVEIIFK